MECQFVFNLLSEKLEVLSTSYDVEKYDLPCEVAINFLRNLDRSYRNYPIHKVAYYIKKGDEEYRSNKTETPRKAAAKIELFMENPKFMPQTYQD